MHKRSRQPLPWFTCSHSEKRSGSRWLLSVITLDSITMGIYKIVNRKEIMKKRIKHNDLIPWFTMDHDQLPASYLKSTQKFFDGLQVTSYKLPGPRSISNANKGLIHKRNNKQKGNYESKRS